MSVSLRSLCVAAAVTLMLAGSGCSSVPSVGTGNFFGADQPSAEPAPMGTAVVEIRELNKKPKVLEMPVGPTTCVQDAIVHSKVLKKFRRVNPAVVRTSPEGHRHKMDCQFDVGKGHVQPEYDYALQPGDYVILAQDDATIFDDMFKSVSGPLGRMSSHRH